MNALDSPLEALALNYLSFGFLTAANNVWAWIAVITAAVSVWRIRASSPRCKSLNRESSLLTSFSSSCSSSTSSSSEFESVREAAEPAEPQVHSTSAVSVFQTEGRTSGKFAVYYRDEEEQEEESDCGNYENNDDIDGLDDGVSREWLGNGWEGKMKMRMDGMGWYHYQDLTVLDGNVVRLWEGCRRRNDAPLSISCGGTRW